MTGIEDVWPDDPGERVHVVIEPIRGTFSVEYVADRAEVDEWFARRELRSFNELGIVEQCDVDEWRVREEARNAEGLIDDPREPYPDDVEG